MKLTKKQLEALIKEEVQKELIEEASKLNVGRIAINKWKEGTAKIYKEISEALQKRLVGKYVGGFGVPVVEKGRWKNLERGEEDAFVGIVESVKVREGYASGGYADFPVNVLLKLEDGTFWEQIGEVQIYKR